MTQLRSQQVVDAITTLLRNNLTDMNTQRAIDGKEWIHKDFPLLSARSPRIGVELLDEPAESGGIGTAQIIRCHVQITIVIKRKLKFDYDGDGVAEPTEDCIDYLKNAVWDLMQDNNEWFREQLGNDFIGLYPMSANLMRTASHVYRYITVEALYERN
ncbi:MAG: hypothetical protein U9R01_07040 [candidate division WOR-3 bacterium]|nr:hypothetical protein [candidate division WOR-3 bacterium]